MGLYHEMLPGNLIFNFYNFLLFLFEAKLTIINNLQLVHSRNYTPLTKGTAARHAWDQFTSPSTPVELTNKHADAIAPKHVRTRGEVIATQLGII